MTKRKRRRKGGHVVGSVTHLEQYPRECAAAGDTDAPATVIFPFCQCGCKCGAAGVWVRRRGVDGWDVERFAVDR